MTHRELCLQAADWLLGQQSIDLVAWELKVRPFVYDVVGITSKATAKQKRYAVIECKRTRADLLQDLRAGKMQKYATKASHCYLAGTPEAFAMPKNTVEGALADLSDKGLPANWGVLLLEPGQVTCLRSPQRIRPTNVLTCKSLTRKIARSYMYRTLYGSFGT